MVLQGPKNAGPTVRQLAAINEQLKQMEVFQKKVTASTKKFKKQEEEVNKVLETREQVLTEATKNLKKFGQNTKKFEILSVASFKAYKEAGGNAFEFLDLALSSTNQKVKIFGVEAALARKVMYGFLPPGMFRAVNKLSTVFRFAGGTVRTLSSDVEKSDNLFTKMFKGLGKFPKLMKSNIGDFKKFGSSVKNSMRNAKGILDDPRGGFQRDKRMRGGIDKQKQKIRDMRRGLSTGMTSQADIEKELKKLNKMQKSRVKVLQKSKVGKALLFLEKFSIKSIGVFIGKALLVFGKVTLYLGLFLMVFYALWKSVGKTLLDAVKEAWPAIRQGMLFALDGLMTVWDGIKSIWNGFFGDGDLGDVIDGVLLMAGGLLQFALGVVGTLLIAGFGIAKEFFFIGLQKVYDWFIGIFTDVRKFAKSLPAILATVAFVLAFLAGAPVLLAGLAFVVLYKVGDWIVKKIKEAVPGFASGGTVSSGMQIVGEKGPELVSLPRGSRVHSNSQSRNMVSNSNPVNNFYITINAKDTSDAELKKIAEKLGRMFSTKINRSISSSLMR